MVFDHILYICTWYWQASWVSAWWSSHTSPLIKQCNRLHRLLVFSSVRRLNKSNNTTVEPAEKRSSHCSQAIIYESLHWCCARCYTWHVVSAGRQNSAEVLWSRPVVWIPVLLFEILESAALHCCYVVCDWRLICSWMWSKCVPDHLWKWFSSSAHNPS